VIVKNNSDVNDATSAWGQGRGQGHEEHEAEAEANSQEAEAKAALFLVSVKQTFQQTNKQ